MLSWVARKAFFVEKLRRLDIFFAGTNVAIGTGYHNNQMKNILMATSPKTTAEDLIHYRKQVLLRIFFAVVGGYILTNLLSVFFSYLLPLSKSDAVVTASLLSFAIYTSLIMWVFSVKSLRHVWWGLAVPGVVLGILNLSIEFLRGGL